MAQITVEGLTKRYNEGASNEVLAVDNISLEIDDGEILTLVDAY